MYPPTIFAVICLASSVIATPVSEAEIRDNGGITSSLNGKRNGVLQIHDPDGLQPSYHGPGGIPKRDPDGLQPSYHGPGGIPKRDPDGSQPSYHGPGGIPKRDPDGLQPGYHGPGGTPNRDSTEQLD